MKSHDDRDLMILFLQSMINKKDASNRGSTTPGSKMFGEPKRVPYQLDESQIYDPKTIKSQPRYSDDRKNDSFGLGRNHIQTKDGSVYPQTSILGGFKNPKPVTTER